MPLQTSALKARLRKTTATSGPEAWLLEVGSFPLDATAANWLRPCLEQLIGAAVKAGAPNLEVFLENNSRLADDSFPQRMAPNTPKWRPRMGIGIWPAREPPRLPTKEDFESIKPGEAPVQHRFPLVRVATGLDSRMEALRTMADLGNVVAVATRDDSKGYLQRTKDLLTPAITEPAYLGSGFYAPLLDWASVEKAEAASMESWLAGASLYVRESLEDNGVVIVSPEPMTSVFEGMGFSREPGDEPRWGREIEAQDAQQ